MRSAFERADRMRESSAEDSSLTMCEDPTLAASRRFHGRLTVRREGRPRPGSRLLVSSAQSSFMKRYRSRYRPSDTITPVNSILNDTGCEKFLESASLPVQSTSRNGAFRITGRSGANCGNAQRVRRGNYSGGNIGHRVITRSELTLEHKGANKDPQDAQSYRSVSSLNVREKSQYTGV